MLNLRLHFWSEKKTEIGNFAEFSITKKHLFKKKKKKKEMYLSKKKII